MVNLPRLKKTPRQQKEEFAGLFRASRFVRKYAQSKKPITFDILLKIHKLIFKKAFPEIAGKYRVEELDKLPSGHLPPAPQRVREFMFLFNQELEEKLLSLKSGFKFIEKIVEVATWAHHKIVYIHPFTDGNGRSARLFTNLILMRYGLPPVPVKIEKENKRLYLAALAEIDRGGSYEFLKTIVMEGLRLRFKDLLNEVEREIKKKKKHPPQKWKRPKG